jgi:FtsP/CotA-like multicopper oxidase with cupredoxin domain
VLPLKGRDTSCDPAKPDPVNGICARRIPMVRLTDGKGHLANGIKIDRVRQLVLHELDTTPTLGLSGKVEVFVNNTKYNGLLSPSIAGDFGTNGVTELPRVGSTELWEIINTDHLFNKELGAPLSGHPMHTHLVQFQILNRQKIDMSRYEAAYQTAFGTGPAPLPSSCQPGKFCSGYGPPRPYNSANAEGAIGGNPALSPYLSGEPAPPDPGESGWKDTAKSFSEQVLRLVVRWTPSSVPVVPNKSYAGRNLYSFDPTNGYYVWHCHITGHEDNEMMRPHKVSK